MKNIRFEDITIGMSESLTKTITQEIINDFAKFTGDCNPIHLDEEYAKNTQFKKTIAHGMLCASYFSTIFGTQLPGVGSIYVSQSLKFKSPVFAGDTIIATVIVTKTNTQKRRVIFDCLCKVDERVVIEGNAEFYIPAN